MAESYIDVRFHFDTEHEDGRTYYALTAIQRVGSTIPDEALERIGESLGQSDRWHVGGVNATLDAMVDEDGSRKAVRSYW